MGGLLHVGLALLSLSAIGHSASVRRKPTATKKWTIQMIGYSPVQSDDYVAVTLEAPTGYIVGYEPVAHADRVHHLLIYGCEVPAGKDFWRGQTTCGGGASHILYAWARNAPDLDLPKGVGFAIGDHSNIKYIVMQVHYAQPFAGNVRDYSGVTLHVVEEMPPNLAAVLLLVSGAPIPPQMPAFQNNMSCTYESDTVVHPFAFRTHTHAMGRVVSAGVYRQGQWSLVGRRNPQWPQLFQMLDKPMEIHKGDYIAGTCRFDSMDKTKPTPMGAMGTNEMCNFYMMLYWKATDPDPFPRGALCYDTPQEGSMDKYPKEGTELLPPHPELEHHAHQSSLPFGVIEEARLSSIGGVKLGQIAGISFDSHHNIVLFHRAKRVWDGSTFNGQNRLNDPTPIKDDVILYASFTGPNATLVGQAGAGQFYLPHGIFVDTDDSIFVTDVGAHTVSKYTRGTDGKLTRAWVAGEPLVPGGDSSHFCKPTAVTRLGDSLFVSDGYCNARVVELGLDGKWKGSFESTNGGWKIPHDIVKSPDSNDLIVTDRENGRVFEVRSDGSTVSLFQSSLFNNIYSSDIYKQNLFMIPGEARSSSFGSDELPIAVFVGRMGTVPGITEFAFAPTSAPFSRPHVLRVCPHGDHIYIGDISEGEAVLWKFKVQHEGGTHEATEGGSLGEVFSSMASSYSSRTSSFLIFLLFAGLIVGGAFWAKQKFADKGPQSRFDRAGFKPLNTDIGVSSDESELD